MKTIRFEREEVVGHIVLANPPTNYLDRRYVSVWPARSTRPARAMSGWCWFARGGPNFSVGGDVREWPGKDINWFRTFVAEVNQSYRALEALRVPTICAVQGMVFGGGFELALSCDFVVAAENAVMRCVEVTTGMLHIAGALQRLAERARASRWAMLGKLILGTEAGQLGIASVLTL